jgi:hypothetical protein
VVIKLTANLCIALCSSKNAVSILSARTIKRGPTLSVICGALKALICAWQQFAVSRLYLLTLLRVSLLHFFQPLCRLAKFATLNFFMCCHMALLSPKRCQAIRSTGKLD